MGFWRWLLGGKVQSLGAGSEARKPPHMAPYAGLEHLETTMRKLRCDEERMRRMESEGRIAVFRHGGQMFFRTSAVDQMSRGTAPEGAVPASSEEDAAVRALQYHRMAYNLDPTVFMEVLLEQHGLVSHRPQKIEAELPAFVSTAYRMLSSMDRPKIRQSIEELRKIAVDQRLPRAAGLARDLLAEMMQDTLREHETTPGATDETKPGGPMTAGTT